MSKFVYLFLLSFLFSYSFANSSSEINKSSTPAVNVECDSLLGESLLDIPTRFSTFVFPDVSTVEPNGHLPGADHIPMTADTVLQAYSEGIFPYTTDDEPPVDGWFIGKDHDGSGVKHGVLDFADFRAERSVRNLAWRIKRNDPKFPYRITMDKDFEEVVNSCQSAPRDNARKWLSDDVKASFIELYNRGYGHSVEVWDGDKLIGGTYGIYLNGVFFVETMFTLQPTPTLLDNPETGKRLYVMNSAGKKIEATGRLAVFALLSFLKSKGIDWVDTQVVSKQSGPMGAKAEDRETFEKRFFHAKAESDSSDHRKILYEGTGGFDIDLAAGIPEAKFKIKDGDGLEYPLR